jgi:hypothetical protein
MQRKLPGKSSGRSFVPIINILRRGFTHANKRNKSNENFAPLRSTVN